MALRPGEAIVLFVRRNEEKPDDYFVQVRRSESSFNGNNDFVFAGAQVPVMDALKDRSAENLPDAIDQAVATPKQVISK